MTIPQLGSLIKLDPRDAWASESGSFTPWLAQPENLALLGQAIGLEPEFEATEKNVGPFRADILCKDEFGQWVVIENQLEATDHSHLGQLLTYAPGLDAITMVWVARRFTDEHRAALDWLNENTREEVNFFGLEIELWRIGDSPPAPKFNVISQPNDWSGTARRAAAALADSPLTETKQIQLAATARRTSTNCSRRRTRSRRRSAVCSIGDSFPTRRRARSVSSAPTPIHRTGRAGPRSTSGCARISRGCTRAFAPRVKALVATPKSDVPADE